LCTCRSTTIRVCSWPRPEALARPCQRNVPLRTDPPLPSLMRSVVTQTRLRVGSVLSSRRSGCPPVCSWSLVQRHARTPPALQHFFATHVLLRWSAVPHPPLHCPSEQSRCVGRHDDMWGCAWCDSRCLHSHWCATTDMDLIGPPCSGPHIK
jgi:hypothetical protein